MMAILQKANEHYSTGAPKAPPVWQMICEFANGVCVCATTDGPPCNAVEIMDRRIRNRVEIDVFNAERDKRKAGQ